MEPLAAERLQGVGFQPLVGQPLGEVGQERGQLGVLGRVDHRAAGGLDGAVGGGRFGHQHRHAQPQPRRRDGGFEDTGVVALGEDDARRVGLAAGAAAQVLQELGHGDKVSLLQGICPRQPFFHPWSPRHP